MLLEPGACRAGAAGTRRTVTRSCGRAGLCGTALPREAGGAANWGHAWESGSGSGERWPPPRWPPFALGPGTAPGSKRALAPAAPAAHPALSSPAAWRAAPLPAALPLLAPAPAGAAERAWPSPLTANAPPLGAPGRTHTLLAGVCV